MRNQIPGTVLAITYGEVMATVKVGLASGRHIVAAITLEAVRALSLTEGAAVRVLFKSTEVALSTGPVAGISIRNQLPGTVAAVTVGGAMATVRVAVEGGELMAAITREAVDQLGLARGSSVVALIKSTEVALATA